MKSFDEDAFEELEDQLDFVMGNMTSQRCPITDAGRLYDKYLLTLRGHAIGLTGCRLFAADGWNGKDY
jgi:hypothetical protein